MQGQRSTVDSFSDIFELDHGSSSSGAAVDQQLSWNGILNPVSDCILPSHETDFTFPNAVGHDRRSLSGWCLGETSSSENPGSHTEDKMEHVWPSLLNCAGSAPKLDERQYEPTNSLSLEGVNLNLSSTPSTDDPLFSQNCNPPIPQNMNLNEGCFANNSVQVVESGVCSCGGAETYSSVPGYPSCASSGSVGHLVEESDGRPSSSDGRRVACKRKTFEGVSGQLSLGGNPSFFSRAENNALHSVLPSYNVASGSNVTPTESPQQQSNPRLGIDISLGSSGHSSLSAAGNAESSRRNFRMRINPAHHDSPPTNLLSVGNSSRQSHASPYQSTSRLLSFNQSLELRPMTASSSSPNPSHAMRTPALPRTLHPTPQYNASIVRVGNSSNAPVISGERAATVEEPNLRSTPRNISEHPMFVSSAETRNLLQDPNWSIANGNMRISRNGTSRAGSSSGVHPFAAPTWLPLHNPPAQHSRRLTETVRQSLYQSPGSEAGGQGRNLHPHPSVSAQEIVHFSGSSNLGHHQPYHSPALRLERQGRSRLVSEIRNALDFMRRGGGEGVRFEDVFVLDQSIFYGMAELHDRHRDMRLDVDNMSYEELLALEERIGNVNTGLSEETIGKGLKQRNYMSFTFEGASEVEPCCICQEEYVDGDNIGRLDCGHDFHAGCIKQWLAHKNLCPICKTTALAT